MVDETTPPANAGDLITDFLRDRQSTDVLAVAEQEENQLATEGFGRDIREMSYAELSAIYGRDVAENRFRYYDSVDALEAHNADGTGIIDKAKDSALDAAASLYAVSGNTVGAATVRPLAKLFGVNPDDAAIANAELTDFLVSETRSYRSDFANDESYYQSIRGQLDAQDNTAEAKARVADGQSPLMAALQMTGENFLDTGSRVLQSPEAIREVVAGSLGSLAPSAALARGAAMATTKGVVRLGANTRVASIAQTAAVAATIGGIEASGTYADTLNEVSGMDFDTLAQSPVYGALLEEGYTPQEAKTELANLTAEQAFRRQLPASVALGLLSSRFEAAPVGSFSGAGIVGGLRNIASQGLEELGQGSSSAYNQNVAIQENVDENRDLAEGVGEAGALGLIGGLGQGGVAAIPSASVSAGRNIVEASSAQRFDDPIRDALAGRGNIAQRAAETTGQVVSTSARAAADGLLAGTNAAREAVRPQTFNDPLRQEVIGGPGLAGRAREAADALANVAAPVTDRVRDIANRTDRTQVTEAAAATEATVADLENSANEGSFDTDLRRAILEPDSTSAPKGLESSGSFLRNIVDLSSKLADKSFKPNQSQKAYIASQAVKLGGMLTSMPSATRKEMQKFINAPETKKAVADVKALDLNKVYSDKAKVTSDSIAETIAVAKINPTNVNPSFISKILKESGENISAEDVAVMQSASKIASIVNVHADNEIQISTDRGIGLTKLGRKDTKEPITKDTVSRSILAAGYTDVKGHDLRSVNDFASELFQGAQSTDGKVINFEGQTQDVSQVMTQFSNFVTHMQNKVDALNRSFAGNNEKGTGPQVGWRGLLNGRKFVEEADWNKNSRVAYHRSNPASVGFAQQVENDQIAAVEVYNELRNAFPDRFGSFPEVTAETLLRDETENPTVLDEETTAEGVSEEQNQNEGENQNDDTNQVVNDESNTDDTVLADQESSNAETSEASVDQESNAEIEVSDREAGVEIDQSSDIIVDDNGNPVSFFHGTNALFDTFRDGGIFLTTRKGLAREHARRGEGGTPRLIETNAKLANPLTQQIDNKEDPDAYWLKNSFKLEQAKEAGGYDSIFLFNDNEGMVIADRDDQVIQLDADFDNSVPQDAIPDENLDIQPEATLGANTHESFGQTYRANADAPAVTSLDDFVEKHQNLNPVYKNFLTKLVGPVIVGMNKRLNKTVTNNGKKMPLVEALKDGEFQNFTEYRNTALVDVDTGKYDQQLAELAGIAIVDWMTTETGSDPRQLDELMESMGLSDVDLTVEQFDSIVGGVQISRAADVLAANILRMWNVRQNDDASMGALAGIAENFAKEFLTVLGNSKSSNLINIADIPVVVDGRTVTTQTIRVDGMKKIQDQIREAREDKVPFTAREALFGDRPQGYSISEKHTKVANTQNRSDVKLSPLEQKALRQMQDTPHFQDKGKSAFFEAIGESLYDMLGWQDTDGIENPVLLKSIKGKNLSIQRNLEEVDAVMNELGDNENDSPVYYSVGVTKVGRHQYQGINPQNNKVLRALVSPTWADLDLSNQDHMDSFWLGIAQAADLMKIEKRNHSDVLANVRQDFIKEYGEAKDMAKEWLKTGELDSGSFAQLVGQVEPQIISAIFAVAELEFSAEAGNTTHRTSLSVELDGLTNGAANMMVNFGQGQMTDTDFKNFNRVGLFLGKIGTSINDYFSVGNKDMYEKTSSDTQVSMYRGFSQKIGKSNPEMLKAAANFSAFFGDLTINQETGDIEMTRNTAKNPMTKVNYGSGVQGVGTGLADAMEVAFYEKIQGIPDGTDLRTYFGYPGIYSDIQTLFGQSLPNNLEGGKFVFSSRDDFRKNVANTLGTLLTETTKTVIGDPITEVNDMMVFSTNVQNQYLQILFTQRINELAEKRAKEGKIRRTAKGDPQIADMTRRDYQSVVKEMSALAPLFTSDEQTLAIGSFSKQLSNLTLSSNMDGKMKQKSLLQAPDEVGVRAIPYQVIGTGDAMMMNFFFGSDTAPNDALGIFDGIDVPVTKLKEYAQLANEAVLKSWDRDVMALGVNNFEGFLSGQLDNDILAQAFQMVKDANKTTSVVAADPQELLTQLQERLRLNRARKAVMKRIPLSVDQMGGSSTPYTRGEGELGQAAINYEIQKEIEGRSQKEEDVKIPIQVSNTTAILNNLRMSGDQKKVAEILKPLLKDVSVVIGTIDQINTYRQENFPDDGQILEGNAQYDAGNGIIFSTTVEASTLLHEMVHAATYGRVLDHYTGTQNDAVTRLEALMEEFLDLESTTPAVNEAKAAILRQQAQNDPQSKAAAVNEFMAYALTSNGVKSALQNTQTKTLRALKDTVIKLMRRLMGGIPATMFDNVVFNTKVLVELPIDNDGNGDGNDGNGSDGENTPDAERHTNKWIELIREKLDDLVNSTGVERLQKFGERGNDFQPYIQGKKIIDDYRQAGMLNNENARDTFLSIYMVMASEMKLDSNSVIALTKVFQHIENNITPEMFGSGSQANQEYSAVISSFGNYKSGNISDAVSVLLALSQTSQKFRSVLDQIPEPQGDAQVDGTLNTFLGRASSGLMRKIMGSIDTTDREVLGVMDQLADSLVNQDQEREFRYLSTINDTFDKADEFTSGKLSELAGRSRAKHMELRESTRSTIVKKLSNVVVTVTNSLDKYGSEMNAEAAKNATHMNTPILSLVPIRELVSEFIGTDRTNRPIVALMDEVNSRISGMRQAYREDLPGILQNQFETHPDQEQWKSMHTVLGMTDFTRFLNIGNMQQGMALLEESGRRRSRITELEQAVEANLLPYIAEDAKKKAQQLANYMNGQGAGTMLFRNAYAIVKNLDGNFEESMVEVVDELVTMYAIDGMDNAVRETTVQLWQNEPKAITGMVSYIQGLNEAEDQKPGISEQARLNAYKGFIPNHGDGNTRIIVDEDGNENALKKRGYTKLQSFEGDVNSITPRSYYVTTTRQGGAYSQGVMQNVHQTFRGVDINTGLTVTGDTSGFISDDGVVSNIVDELNNQRDVELNNDKDVLMPVFDVDGTVLGFERSINPDLLASHMRKDGNMAVMLGAWAGRHVEEMLATEYNKTLVDELDSIWENRESGSEDRFVNLKDTKDPIYKESFKLIPQGTKNYIDGKFGGEGFMVLKDQANLSVGYREASLADFWSGKTRLPKPVQKAVVGTTQFFMGRRAMQILTKGEEALQGVVSAAKDIIVIRSLIVPAMNIRSNYVQLTTNGVPQKMIQKGFRDKLAEIEEYNKNVTQRIELEAKLRLAARNANQKRIIESQIQVIDDLNNRMSIAPMIAAGAYKNLSEGITDLDVDITKGRLGDVAEALANKLPDGVSNVTKVGLVSKSTKLYQAANRATQYGDFLAKSIYYDHLISQGLSEADALTVMNEEFVNFSFLPGRVRSSLERMGFLWFPSFKIRTAKIALRQVRENPVRALAINSALPDIGSPVQDNIFSVIADDRLGYSTGFEMLFDAPGLNPWVNLLDG